MAEDIEKVVPLLILFGILCAFCSADDCVDGKFGWKCRFTCRCKNDDVCNKITGECPNGCQDEYYGSSCLFENDYKYTADGKNYQGNIGTFFKDGTLHQCQDWNNSIATALLGLSGKNFPDKVFPGPYCRFPTGDSRLDTFNGIPTDPWCSYDWDSLKFASCGITRKEACEVGRYGPNCLYECHCADITSDCNQKTGKCTSGCHPGWIGEPGCQTKCPPGKYGLMCKEDCGNCKKDLCDFESGVCSEGCEAGYHGDTCKQECSPGTYGENCLSTCGNCLDGMSCDKLSGQCLSGCSEGYLGVFCQTGCSSGTYGMNCSKNCGKCKDESYCHHVDGRCVLGCSPGWTSYLCDQGCDEGLYGQNCSNTCGSCKDEEPCDIETGECVTGCAPGYTGSICAQVMINSAGANAGATGGVVAGTIIFLVIIAIIVFIVYRKRKFNKTLEVQQKEKTNKLPVEEDPIESTRETDQLLRANGVASLEPERSEEEPIYANVNTHKQSMPVKVQDLYDYIKLNKAQECDGFKKEFAELPHGLMALCEAAKKPENRPKNRYGNIIAYDHSRVLLDPGEEYADEVGADYINANYIDGYTRASAYIASQGATKVMLRDFWRMVWQKKTCKIVMLTNVMEACKKKCEQYWPDSGSMKYGSINVEILDTAVFTDFTIRTFNVSLNEASRTVKQFHFTSWSDHGALTYPTPLLTFKRKVETYTPESTAPIVVHCSAGIGRSGTYIALDYLMYQAKAEGVVDVLRCAQLMRCNRINMIQTWEQYVFVYEALLEALKAGDTTIPNDQYRRKYEEMSTLKPDQLTTPLEDQFQAVQEVTHTMDTDEYKAAMLPENLGKNRVKNILPANRCRPHLYTQVEGCNDYINAIFLSGYTHRDAFIVTQMPLPNTVADFWRMLYDYNSNTVVMLNDFDRNDQTCALYWPEEHGYTVEYDPLSIELLSSREVDPNVSERIFKVCNHMKGEARAIKQFQLRSWSDSDKVPDTAALVQLLDMVCDWLKQSGKGPITVHCMNGASKSGVFCAVSLLLERMQRDHEVDVFQTVMAIRTNRPQFIEDLEQYNFCYKMALEYIDTQ
ncbi:receptor-type tyrosine-protein phosphatase kappa-like [Ylistrum balloti]|uniref:receptor-type tyrosine-protein phosphatase kappa-like n=1 Tax=Ylistrum balloti TaxID=509963 RepID=UPI002905AB9E|nr:receptor-type tyrosine-protein phosphatase kappa-like [Ylistrum balloti]